jgi:hypothetical protein
MQFVPVTLIVVKLGLWIRSWNQDQIQEGKNESQETNDEISRFEELDVLFG